MLVMTAPLPQALPYTESVLDTSPVVVAEPGRIQRLQTRYRLYRVCGWGRVAAAVIVLWTVDRSR
jgi:hypothetical protein